MWKRVHELIFRLHRFATAKVVAVGGSSKGESDFAALTGA
jgi:hypothetical protein